MGTGTSSLTDLHKWLLETSQAIRERRFSGVDWERVAEELHSLGISEKAQLESRLTQLVYHLLKCEFQPERQSRSWELSVNAQRNRIYRLLRNQPSLKPYLADRDFLEDIYEAALAESARENLPDSVVTRFPSTNPYSVDMLLPDLRAKDYGSV